MTDTKLSINDFVGESGWSDTFMGGGSLTRFNTDCKVVDDILTTTDGFRSVYLNLLNAYSAGKVKMAMKVSSAERGIAFILGCGDDGRNPVEIFCNQELNDSVILNVDVKHSNVYYCSAQTSKNDVNILRQLNEKDNLFKSGTWYNVKITLDYDKLNASDDTDAEEWITFSMIDDEGNVLADETLTHLSQAVTPNLKQVRIICKGETKIKDFALKVDKTAKASTATKTVGYAAAPVALASVTAVTETLEEIPEMTDEEMISEVNDKVIVSTDGIKVPEYIFKSNGDYISVETIDDLMRQRKSEYATELYKYRILCESKYINADKLAPYRFASYVLDVNNIITTNDFADRDVLLADGYKPIYIGHSASVRNYPADYGTYKCRNTHVIPENDYMRCQYIVNEGESVNDVLNRIFEAYPDMPIVVTFMDGEYKFDITGGAGTEDEPYKCVAVPRDNVIFRTFDYNTNFTLADKSKVANGESLLFFDVGEYENISIFGLNYFLEDIPYSEEYYKFPKVSDKVQAVIDYVNSLEQYPDINTVSAWVADGLPKEIVENIELKETNSALEAAVLELAQMVSDLSEIKGGTK